MCSPTANLQRPRDLELSDRKSLCCKFSFLSWTRTSANTRTAASVLVFLFSLLALMPFAYSSAGSTPTYADSPMFWSWSGSLNATTAGGTSLTISGQYFLLPGQCTISPVVLFTSNSGSTATCTITSQIDSQLVCTVPAGTGAPQVTINICGQLNRNLPRMPIDFVFYVGTTTPYNPSWCTTVVNSNVVGFRSSDTPVNFCSSDSRQNFYTTCQQGSTGCAPSMSMFLWSSSGPSSTVDSYSDTDVVGDPATCVNIYDPASPSSWSQSYLCAPTNSTYRFVFYPNCATNPSCFADQCIQLMNPNAVSSTMWTSGAAYLCTTFYPMPFVSNDQVLQYHYLPPYIQNISQSHSPTIGGISITLYGYSFGFTNVTTIFFEPATAECAITFSNHTIAICIVPAGQGASNYIQMTTNGLTSNVVPFSYDPPLIYTILPFLPDCGGGTNITIAGINFGTSGSVVIGAMLSACSPIYVYNNVEIICLLPAGQGINLTVYVQPTGYPTNLLVNYGLISYLPPNVTSVFPTSFLTTGAVTMNITGHSFGSSGTVNIGGQLCSLTGMGYSTNLIQCILPAGQGANLSVVVTASGQTSSPSGNFSYTPPILNAIGPQGGSGSSLLLTIMGYSFGSGVNSSILINGIACVPETSSWNPTMVLCYASNGGGLYLPVQMTVSGQISNFLNYTYTPSISSVVAIGGSAPTTGGVLLNVTGAGYALPTVAVATVLAGLKPCPVSAQTASWISCTLPPGGGTIPVTVTIVGLTSSAFSFSYSPPSLYSVAPTIGSTGGGQLITLTGINFGPTPSVTLSGINCLLTFKNNTQLIAVTPAGSGAYNPVIASAGGGLITSSINYAYFPPTLVSLAPLMGPASGDFNLTLTGNNFSADTSLTFVVASGTSVSPIFQNDTTIVFLMPAYSTDPQVSPTILVNGQSSDQQVYFAYYGSNISNVSPPTGPTVGNITLTIVGTDFGSTGYVLVGGSQAPLTGKGYSDTYIECTLPAGMGPAPIAVIVGNFVAKYYTWSYNSPVINSITPTSYSTSGNALLTIVGTDFGTSGTVAFGTYTCVTNVPECLYTTTQIICQIPPGQGANLSVVVNVSTLTNALEPLWSYNPPIISELSPVNGPTIGGGVMTVYGSNFGLTATVSFVSANLSSSTALICLSFGIGQSHTQIQCLVPSYQGANIAVFVTVSQQQSAAALYSYFSPIISSILPISAPTAGGTNITVTGTNFGIGNSYIVKLNYASLVPIFYNQTQFIFVSPEGSGGNIPFTLAVSGQSASYNGALFSYQAPTITYITGCTDMYPGTTFCPTSPTSPHSITISGTNFYTSTSLSNVTVNGLPCSSLLMLSANTKVSCSLPSSLAGGFNVPVIITVNGLSGSANYLSYAGPIFTPNTLVFASQTSSPNTNVISGNTGQLQFLSDPYPYPINVTLHGQYWTDNSDDLAVYYGLPSQTHVSPCVIYPDTVSFDIGNSSEPSSLTCAIWSGVGANLTFQLTAGYQTSQESIDSFSYAKPLIIADTIRSNASGVGSTAMIGQSSQGDQVFFDVQHIGNMTTLSFLSVYFGPAGVGPWNRSCVQPSLTEKEMNIYTVSCLTGSGSGSGYTFQIHVSNQISEPGNDTYSYITAPSVSSVTGCVDSQGGTYSCPTFGGTSITIYGFNFTSNAQVSIGSNLCQAVQFFSVNKLSCTTPAGAGASLAITITNGIVYSPPTYLIGYASASVTQISGCIFSFSGTIDCARSGGDILTLSGYNFGPPNATILISGNACAVISSNDTEVQCSAPGGTLTQQSVILIQNGGSLTVAPSSVYVSYQQCPQGQYAVVGNTTCSSCVLGTYADTIGLTSCKTCVPGTFINTTGSSACSLCPAGTYAGALPVGATTGATTCTYCSSGSYNLGSGSTTCSLCPAGSFNSQLGLTICSACFPGTYSSNANSSVCQYCPQGQYSSYSGAVSCTDCPIGTISNGSLGGSSSCVDCLPGTVTTASGKTTCMSCNAGYYAPTSRLGACLSCDAGTFSNATGMSSCYTCPAGYYSFMLGAAGATSCTQCQAGTYSDAIGQGKCLSCEQGTFSSSTGNIACQQCAPGMYTDTVGQTSCFLCPSGTYASGNGTVSCGPCPLGTYNNQTRATACVQCSVGTVAPSVGQSSCAQCSPGTYMPSTGQAVCLACDSGTYANISGLTSCISCPAGSFCSKQSGSNVGTILYASCIAGTYSSDGAESCLSCDAGTFQAEQGSSSCDRCSAGTAVVATGSTVCTNCTAGNYVDTTGALHCLPCPIGYFGSGGGATGCTACSQGTYAPSSGLTACFQCGRGTYTNLPGQGNCQQCHSGSYNTVQGASTCALCSSGTFQPVSGQTACSNCSVGYSQGANGQVSCQQCPAGSYSAQLGSSICFECEAGSAVGTSAASSCVSCLPGTYTSSVGQLECASCPLGTYTASSGSSTCTLCAAGSYSGVQGSTTCSECLVGTYSAVAGSIGCSKCSPGTYAYNNGSFACSDCNLGTYQALSGNVTCLMCPNGTYTDATGSAACINCPAGTVPLGYYDNTQLEGTDGCQDCGPGTYQPAAGRETCLLCGPGSYTDMPGQASCLPCAAGHVFSGYGASNCTACGPGSFQAAAGQPVCAICPQGQFSNATAASTCSSCSPGSFTNGFSSTSCTQCNIGYYQNLAGQKSCSPCDIGSYNTDTGLASCAFCSPGTYQNSTGQSSCMSCPIGTYQSLAGQTTCSACLEGTYSSTAGASACTLCSPGSFQNNTGSTYCFACAPGSAQGNNGKINCSLCDPGYVMLYPGHASCTACPPGQYISAPGALNCNNCGIGTFTSIQGSSTCLSCGPGTFQDGTSQSGCQNCALGTASNTSGLTVPCPNCLAGSFSGVPGETSCSACAEGSFGPSPGLSSCLLCLAGTFSNMTGATACVGCGAGLAQPVQGQNECLGCAEGFYSLGGQSSCTACEAGYFSVTINATGCLPCGEGHQQPIPGQTSCQSCPVGSASISDHIDICPLCTPGSFQNMTGQTGCQSCDMGQYEDQSGASSCSECAPGTYNAGTNARNCTATSKGYFTNTTGATTQTVCAAGSYQPDLNSTSCLLCPPGQAQASEGSSECTDCASGTFTNTSGNVVCNRCDIGSFQANTGQTACILCSPGYYADVQNKESCDPCAAGYFTASYGTSICVSCSQGYHQPANNATTCLPCSPGTFSNSLHSILCEECSHGSFQAFANATSCDLCGVGTAQSQTGNSACTDCQPGSFSNSTGLSACNLCDPGYFMDGLAALSCLPCSFGTAATGFGATTCTKCSLGQFSNQEHLSSCYPCPTGSFTVINGSQTCEQCQPGSFQANTGQTTCDLCSPGYSQNQGNQDQCSPCGPGYFADEPGLIECIPCTPGFYQRGSGQPVCFPCPVGTYHNGTGATQCSECNYGQFQQKEGSTSCSLCSPGTFKSDAGAGGCLPCWPGEYNSAFGQNLCAVCPAGTHSNNTLSTDCVSCEEGTASAAVNTSVCSQCQPGFYMPNTGQTECLPCPVGFFSSISRSIQCEKCPLGAYQPFLGQSSCLSCQAGQSTAGPGSSFCVDCPSGEYGTIITANSTSTGSCLDCIAGTYADETGVTVCKDCAAGFYSPPGQTLCTACADLTVSASPGGQTCVLCDANSISNLLHTECLCAPGWYLPSTHVPGSSFFQCITCPVGASCAAYGTTYANLQALPGWWRANNATLNFYRCPISSYCLGGYASAPNGGNSDSGDSLIDSGTATACTDNRGGIMCSSCEIGFTEQTGGSCVACPKSTVSYVSLVFIAAAVVFLIWLQIWIIIRSGREAITKGLQSEAAADCDSIAGFNYDSDSDDSTDESESDSEYETDTSESDSASVEKSISSKSKSSLSQSLSKERENDGEADGEDYNDAKNSDEVEDYEYSSTEDEEPENPADKVDPATINFHVRYGPPEKTPDFTYKLKIFLSFLQIATNLGTNLNIVWPTTYVNFLLFFDVANFDFVLSSAASVDCIGSFNYYTKFVAIVLAPPVILLVTALVFLLPNYLEIGPFRKYTLQERQRGKMNFWRLFLYLLFLVYPSVSSTVLRLYVCQQIDDASYLTTDLQVQCYTSEWTTYTYASLILILLYPIGIPIFFFSILRVNQAHLHEPRIKAQLGFLYAGYRAECWWFEIAENIHKLMLTSVLAFFPSSAQLPTGMALCVLYFLILLLIHPYLSPFDDLLSLYSECEIFLLVTAGWIFYNNPSSSTNDNLLLSICLIAITVFFFLAFLLAVMYVMVTFVVRWRTKRILAMREKREQDERQNPKPTPEFVEPFKIAQRGYVFVKEWLEETKENDEYSSLGKHSRASLSHGEDRSDDGDLDIKNEPVPNQEIVHIKRSVFKGKGEQTIVLEQEEKVADSPTPIRTRIVPAELDSGSESDEEVDVFGLDIDDDGHDQHINSDRKPKKKKRRNSNSDSEEKEERDELDDLANLVAPRIRREGEEEDITKRLDNVLHAAER